MGNRDITGCHLQICLVEIVLDGRTTVRVEARQQGSSGAAGAAQGGSTAARELLEVWGSGVE